MPPVATPAIVLHSIRYSETSKIVRLATRELGVQSAIAKGALRKKSPFGGGLELLSEGVAQLAHREQRELQILTAFDVTVMRTPLAQDLPRFAAASVLAEVMLRVAPAAPLPSAFDLLRAYLDL
ncbi:MAG: DNA repair protein RecO, partial [Gemmatimonadales bacterium]